MIAQLKGILDAVGDGWVIIDVGGVGYQAFCSAKTLQAMPQTGEAVKMSIITHVREDHIHLFGFISAAEKEWFDRLLGVQGVGAKVALAILSTLDPGDLTQTILAQDKAMMARPSGVGPKLATRILTELKDKVPAFGSEIEIAALGNSGRSGGADAGALSDAVSALVNLGYRRADVMGAVARANQAQGGDADLQTLVTAGLKELSA
ncbi:MAG: Holliday junction branch migration protein RuvA [Alphaproteobacteria bacterium]|nr:MAG: Holliday junction branch migration protein RuvA [Alphaproteobacteria bacterium]